MSEAMLGGKIDGELKKIEKRKTRAKRSSARVFHEFKQVTSIPWRKPIG
jgi:hypothetical protein